MPPVAQSHDDELQQQRSPIDVDNATAKLTGFDSRHRPLQQPQQQQQQKFVPPGGETDKPLHRQQPQEAAGPLDGPSRQDFVWDPVHPDRVLRDAHHRPVTVERWLRSKPLQSEIQSRPGPGGKKLLYLSGDSVTRILNHVFGYQGWNLGILKTEQVVCQEDKGRWHVAYTALVRITLQASGSFREDVGAGDAMDKHLPTAVQHALKGSITDAMKRAARHFGDKLGNSLYQSNFQLAKAPKHAQQALEMLERERQTVYGLGHNDGEDRLPCSYGVIRAPPVSSCSSTNGIQSIESRNSNDSIGILIRDSLVQAEAHSHAESGAGTPSLFNRVTQTNPLKALECSSHRACSSMGSGRTFQTPSHQVAVLPTPTASLIDNTLPIVTPAIPVDENSNPQPLYSSNYCLSRSANDASDGNFHTKKSAGILNQFRTNNTVPPGGQQASSLAPAVPSANTLPVINYHDPQQRHHQTYLLPSAAVEIDAFLGSTIPQQQWSSNVTEGGHTPQPAPPLRQQQSTNPGKRPNPSEHLSNAPSNPTKKTNPYSTNNIIRGGTTNECNL